jgi:hypothetical protein
MSPVNLAPGVKPAEARKAFETILGDLEKVRPLNYRSPVFSRWRQLVQTALDRFLGPDHPDAKAFKELQFHGPLPKPPMEPPVSEKDVAAYASAMAATTRIIEAIVVELREPAGAGPSTDPTAEPAAAPASAAGGSGPRPAPAAASPPDPSRFVATPSPPPAGAAAHDLPRHAGTVPAGGIKIVSRSGSGPISTLDQFIESSQDAQERELLLQLKAVVDDPQAPWSAVKHLLAELWWVRRDSVQKILPVILRR